MIWTILYQQAYEKGQLIGIAISQGRVSGPTKSEDNNLVKRECIPYYNEEF